jgi:hypothetical protein
MRSDIGELRDGIPHQLAPGDGNHQVRHLAACGRSTQPCGLTRTSLGRGRGQKDQDTLSEEVKKVDLPSLKRLLHFALDAKELRLKGRAKGKGKSREKRKLV